MPNVVIIAGPNGSGKSTSAPALVHEYLGITKFVNADTIAAGLSAFDSSKMAIEAGRIMLHRLETLVEQKADFAFETTLASRSFAKSIQNWKAKDYRVHLFFMWLPSPELAIARVQSRVFAGGHDIPENVVKRRYVRGLRNLTKLYLPIVDTWRVYNCTSPNLNFIAVGQNGDVQIENVEIWNRIKECGNG